MKFFICRVVLSSVFLSGMVSSVFSAERPVVSLAGEWRFALDSKGVGEQEGWANKKLDDSVQLPGTTDTNKKGELNHKERRDNRLTRRYTFIGKAWYQRDITIPSEWSGKRITLFLERSRATRVWVDGAQVGTGLNTHLSVPHIYVLENIKPGKHTLSIEVDNGYKFPVRGHMTSEDCQVNWNGIVGRIELMATDPIWIDRVRVTSNLEAKTESVEIRVMNESSADGKGVVLLQAQSFNEKNIAPHKTDVVRQKLTLPVGESTHTLQLPLGSDARLWSEFSPALYNLQVSLQSTAGKNKYGDRTNLEFGFREFRTKGLQFTINGKTTFLRGKHDSLVSPLTGYAAMDLESSMRFFQTVKDYGLNHVRYHTACPPEAAFKAASRLGLYLQPETPFWGKVNGLDDAPVGPYVLKEGKAILDAFGNYPTFCIFSNGNEGSGERAGRAEFVTAWRTYDPRFLYINGANCYFWDPQQMPGDDLWVSARTKRGADGAVRASFSHANVPLGAVEAGPPGTRFDFSKALTDVTVPIIGHETGQYQVYPNFDEIKKYTGVVEARNFELFKERLEAAGMGDQWRDFFRVSGALSLLCYKEDTEISLRTRNFAGFQMLDLQDFPGQGTALVGILDAFMDSKGIVTPENWRKFCCETVPLLRFDRYTWTQNQTFSADVQVAHYGPEDLRNTSLKWSLKTAKGKTLDSGTIPAGLIAQGTLADIGQIKIPLNKVSAPSKVYLVISIPGTPYANHYALWVYPNTVKTDLADAKAKERNVVIAKAWTPALQQQLEAGATALLIPKDLPKGSATLGGLFMTDYWCFPMFNRICQNGGRESSPGTLGLLCNPKHPAFAQFTTDDHTDWQWWYLIKNSRPLILDGSPADYRPIGQIVDNFDRNHKLGLIFETKVGKGKLLVCMADLWSVQKQPEAKQLFESLLAYAQSPAFQPAHTLSDSILDRLTGNLFPMHPDQPNWSVSASSEEEGKSAINMLDNNAETYWHSRWSNPSANYPHTITLDLKKSQPMGGLFYLPRQKDSINGTIKDWKVEISSDGESWKQLVKGRFSYPKKGVSEQTIRFPAKTEARYVRLIALSEINNAAWASAAEVRVLTAEQLPKAAKETDHDTSDYNQL